MKIVTNKIQKQISLKDLKCVYSFIFYSSTLLDLDFPHRILGSCEFSKPVTSFERYEKAEKVTHSLFVSTDADHR